MWFLEEKRFTLAHNSGMNKLADDTVFAPIHCRSNKNSAKRNCHENAFNYRAFNDYLFAAVCKYLFRCVY